MASCAVPLWAGYRPVKFRGHNYVDGGFTNNLPELYPGKTIRIQPFSTSSENAEVSPILSYPEGRVYQLRNSKSTMFRARKDSNAKLIQKCPNQNFTMYLKYRNLHRAFVLALFPTENEKWYKDLLKEGHHDATVYLNSIKLS